MSLKIALAGNPNCGKTTLFNALTGSNQFVGNWPGVTVEKKEGKLKKSDGVVITDLPGIYSLSPYTLEEVVARNYLIEERPDAILNIIDGTNLERNLYLTTQLTELGIPVVIAINMMDIVKKNGDQINIEELSRELGCKVVEISALKGTGIKEAADAAVEAAKNGKTVPMHTFSGPVEHTIAHIEEAAVHNMPEEQQRWYAIKLFERDDKVIEKLNLDSAVMAHIDEDIKNVEKELDDDAESIITNERYVYIAEIIKGCYKKKSAGKLTTSDKIDKVVTNRFAALPIFAVIMFLVYYISMVTVGTAATDWANDGLFGDGWHLFGIGSADYEDASGTYSDALEAVNGFVTIEPDSEDFEPGTALETLKSYKPEGENPSVQIDVEDEETLEVSQLTVYYKEIPANADKDTTLGITYLDAVKYFEEGGESAFEEPDPASYGVWVPGIPVLIEQGLDAVNCVDWLKGLILDGIVAGVGAVLGFVPQMLVLFILLAILEACGYMARIAFVLDRIFRKFGLSGKSFIPILVGTGCGIPGIMASRTIENERDRRMTILLTPFMSCSAKLPIYALFTAAFFPRVWRAPVMIFLYLFGILCGILYSLILKQTCFRGEPVPFVMELPNYRLPSPKSVGQLIWEKARDFIQRAFTIIFVATVVIWFLQTFDTRLNVAATPDSSLLALVGSLITPIFKPLGFGDWRISTALITGFTAKESVVSTLTVLLGGDTGALNMLFTPFTALVFLIFTLLYTPCVAAIAAVKRELGGGRAALGVVLMQCGIAWVVAFAVHCVGVLLGLA